VNSRNLDPFQSQCSVFTTQGLRIWKLRTVTCDANSSFCLQNVTCIKCEYTKAEESVGKSDKVIFEVLAERVNLFISENNIPIQIVRGEVAAEV
jgi:hypothetical protein